MLLKGKISTFQKKLLFFWVSNFLQKVVFYPFLSQGTVSLENDFSPSSFWLQNTVSPWCHFASPVQTKLISFNTKFEKNWNSILGEGVGTSNFTIMTGHFFHYIKSPFLVDHYYNITKSKMAFELITTSKLTKITTTKIRTSKRMWKEHQKSQFCLIFTFWLPMA